MNFTVVKIECPSCGATPEMDKNMEFGFCPYCGTKIYIPNAIQKIRGTVSVDKSNETENLLKRAAQYETAGDFDKADEYYERVLDIDAENAAAHRQRPRIQIRKAIELERQGNIPLAEQILQRALRLYPVNEAVRAELHRITTTIYAPNVTIINATKDKKTIFELFENGSKNKVVDLPKTENSRIDLSFPVGRHTINAGKGSNNFEFSIESYKTCVIIKLEPKMFGCVIRQVDKLIAPVMKKDPNRLYCPKCGSDDISVQIVETGTVVKEGIGVAGQINNMARGVTALGTLGMSNLVWKKSKPQKTLKVNNKKICICQDCGKSWEIKD